MTFVSELEPHAVWRHFDEILTIPRPSKGEERMRDHIVGLAKKAGLDYEIDGTGNLVVRKPGTPGHESAPPVVLQGHLDMVEEKNSDTDHDFTKDPIRPQRDGDYLKATGTTLGSDNGIGVAAMLAVMEATDLVHGPLELLFTVDEETGLTGAAGLAANLLRGRRLINLDSEEEGVLTIGCAGGADTHLHLSLTSEKPAAGSGALALRVHGLKGGHSGIDIHLQRGNAIKQLVRAIYASSLDQPLRLAALQGGNAHNAIPREATAVVVTDAGATERLAASLRSELEAIRAEFLPAEPDMAFSIEATTLPKQAWDGATTDRVSTLINSLHHGVAMMSYEIPGLVESSSNLAVVTAENDRMKILISSRGSIASGLTALRQRIRATARLAAADVQEKDGYPGWKPDVRSQMLETVKALHEEVTGKQPEVGAVHAGLECGIIGEKYPGMDMISFGPQIEFPHSPDERIKIDTVAPFYQLLTKTLQRLA